MKEKNKAHLIGIAGTGMSALAILLKEAGWQITGSDSNPYEPILGYLKKNKINFFKNYSAKNIPKDANLVVIGKHARLAPETNQEVKQAFRSGIEIKSLPQTLAELSKNKNNLVVTGSYGKSTCSALLSWCLIKAKKKPSYFIGAVPIGFKKSSHIGNGKDFIIEGDEYPSANWDNQSKFLHFNPTAVLLTSVEHDHKNVFKTEKSYKEPYKKLVAKIPKKGFLVFAYEGKNNKEVAKNAKCRKISYSLQNKKSDYYAQNIKYGAKTSFILMHKSKEIVKIKTKLLGKYNIENIIGCGAFLLENKKIAPKKFTQAVGSFRGIKRRIELLTKKSSIPVYEGFGSSYQKAKVIFDAIRLHFPEKRIVAVFEPHTFSWRNRGALKWYKNIFDGVAEVILLPPPVHGKNTHDQLTFNEIFNEVKKHVSAHKAGTEKKALHILKKIVKKNDIVALVSSGSLLGLSKSVPKMLS
jgi:UDP-N-acetylmuramate: L-alanyl-gamma-D-glutamyl-meso-diaminopimelate ligase